ncbi:hypothetical protein GCM10028798_20640 [Humibacter antri]
MIWAWVTVGFIVAAMGLGALFLTAAVVWAREERARNAPQTGGSEENVMAAATAAGKADTSRSRATLSER